MKMFIIILIVLFAVTIKTNAQIPNSGFENWTTVGSYEDPTGWATYNSYSTGSFYSCTKSTDHYPTSVGNYSIRLENDTSLTQMTGGWGMAMTDTMAYPLQPAFPIVGHPNSLCGYYKYNSLNNDSLYIRIILFENGTAITAGSIVSSVTTTSWTPFSIPITSYSSADSAMIFMIAFSPTATTSVPKGNSVLYVDNLSFDNFITSNEEIKSGAPSFTLYPNPASDIVTLNINNANIEDCEIRIYNIMGVLMRSELLKQNQQQISVGDLSNGIYMITIKSKDLAENQKLIIQR